MFKIPRVTTAGSSVERLSGLSACGIVKGNSFPILTCSLPAWNTVRTAANAGAWAEDVEEGVQDLLTRIVDQDIETEGLCEEVMDLRSSPILDKVARDVLH